MESIQQRIKFETEKPLRFEFKEPLFISKFISRKFSSSKLLRGNKSKECLVLSYQYYCYRRTRVFNLQTVENYLAQGTLDSGLSNLGLNTKIKQLISFLSRKSKPQYLFSTKCKFVNFNFEINGESILPIHKKMNGLN